VPVKMVIYAAYQNDRAAIWLGKEMSIPVVQLPYTVGGADNVVDLFSLFDVTIERLLRALQT
jgi:zinc/manganese transport system substrate-binding protein